MGRGWVDFFWRGFFGVSVFFGGRGSKGEGVPQKEKSPYFRSSEAIVPVWMMRMDDNALIVPTCTVQVPYLCPDCRPPHDVFSQVHCNHQTHKCAYHKQL